ncbi:unnamed protein product [Rhizoctonia solani]|uniref:Uncharacterized protein n=1 Tax=Rhizoctonia solani TaxID=456999 RepID=A0A8H3E173_9AGAM|nr:unnamed protein product [Rhizoctonia solani]
MFMELNASTFVMYGPCGPKHGLMRVTIDNKIQSQQQIVNTSRPIASNSCLLFQAWSLSVLSLDQVLIENLGGGMLGVERFNVTTLQIYYVGESTGIRATVVACVLLGTVMALVVTIVVYVTRALRKKQRTGGFWRVDVVP